jgi:hypothetical protein
MVVELHGAIYTIFEPNILGFQIFFSGLMAEPTNRAPVWDYDPDTPLHILFKIFQLYRRFNLCQLTPYRQTFIENLEIDINATSR